jgi:single-stranded-DNA-specific exonuclease
MEYKWVKRDSASLQKVEKLVKEVKITPLIANLLVHRGIDTFEKAEHFFRPKLANVNSPFLFKQMEEAVQTLAKAIEKNQKIRLFGDYDVDGTTAVAIMYNVLLNHTDNVDFYIPDRYAEGYGLSRTGAQSAMDHNVDLLITLDCGIRSVELLNELNEFGMKIIVCDHHEPGETLPNAIVLDPKTPNETYPFDGLSGAGVGFKLLEGLYQNMGWEQTILHQQLDLLALSIAADIVPVTNENRIYAFHGLELMNTQLRPVFKKMFESAKRQGAIKLSDLVFGLAPRINAAGRIRSGSTAVQCMLESSQADINELVNEIERSNNDRKQLDENITAEALKMVSFEPSDRNSNVLFAPHWHKGVVGIVASRIIESHPWPTIVLTESHGVYSGSARSYGNFDIHQALEQLAPMLTQFGGHQHAAGLAMLPENFETFKIAFDERAKAYFEKYPTEPTIEIDSHLNFDNLFENESNQSIPKMARILEGFEPYGPGNLKPVFVAKNVYSLESRLLKEAHLKLKVTQPNSSQQMDAIGFNLAPKEVYTVPGMAFSIAFTLDINEFRNVKKLQLMIKDLKEDF